MGTLYTFGLQEIKYNGTKVGEVYKDSCRLEEADGETFSHYEEGVSAPRVQTETDGEFVLRFSIMNPDAQFLQTHKGGTYDSATKKWSWNPGAAKPADGAWEVVPKKGFSGIKIAKGHAKAKVNFEISESGLLLVDFEVTVMQPATGSALEFLQAV